MSGAVKSLKKMKMGELDKIIQEVGGGNSNNNSNVNASETDAKGNAKKEVRGGDSSEQSAAKYYPICTLVTMLPLYVPLSPKFGVPLSVQYLPFFAAFAMISTFFLVKTNLAVSIKSEREIKSKSNDDLAGKKSMAWSLFINNLVFGIMSISLALFVLPSIVGAVVDLDLEPTDPNAISEENLEKLWVITSGLSVILPAYVLSTGITL